MKINHLKISQSLTKQSALVYQVVSIHKHIFDLKYLNAYKRRDLLDLCRLRLNFKAPCEVKRWPMISSLAIFM
jgi:hypothetical protein